MTQVICIGNRDRGDDAAGLEVALRVRVAGPPHVAVTELEGDQVRLLDVWDPETTVILVDATCSGAAPGTVTRFDASRPLAHQFSHRGSHTFSLADVIELARALGRLPRCLSGYGIEGASFAVGDPLSAPAEAGAREVTARLLTELAVSSVQLADPGQLSPVTTGTLASRAGFSSACTTRSMSSKLVNITPERRAIIIHPVCGAIGGLMALASPGLPPDVDRVK